MVKGISRQVVVVRSPDQKLFEQAIFILKDNAAEVTDEALLKEARVQIRDVGAGKHRYRLGNPLWAVGGAAVTGFLWLLSTVL